MKAILTQFVKGTFMNVAPCGSVAALEGVNNTQVM